MKILVFGSSSTKNFNLTDELKHISQDFRGIEVKAVAMSGATITGFGKRNSSLNVREHLLDAYKSYQPDYLCFALGQTDVELGVYYKRVVKKQEFDIDDFLSDLSKKYLDYIINIMNELNTPKDRVIIKGVNPPVITRYRAKAINYTAREILRNDFPIEEKKKYKNQLTDIYPNTYERYNHHVNFNEKIKDDALALGVNKYFDVHDIVADPENPVHVKPEFVAAGMDHHIIDSLYVRRAFINRLIQTIYSI